jgi:hypothetical protein
MPTTIENISILESIVASVTTDMSKWSREKLIEILAEGRAMGIYEATLNGVRIHPLWLQTYKADWDARLQENDCYSTFACPSPIRLPNGRDGHIWVGNNKGTVSYSRVNTIGEMLNRKAHPAMSLSLSRSAMALYEDGVWKVERNKSGFIQELSTRSMFNEPTKVPYFNIHEDTYPIDDVVFDYVKKWLIQMEQTPVLTQRTNKELAELGKQ